jgi:hypothetical protein
VDAAVVELDALADAVGAAAEDDDLLAIGDADLVVGREKGAEEAAAGTGGRGAPVPGCLVPLS